MMKPSFRLLTAAAMLGSFVSSTSATSPPPVKYVIQPAKIELTVSPRGRLISNVSGHAGTPWRRVTADDPMRIASISKLVTGIAVMRLVDRGKIDLDRDVGLYLGWPVRNPAFAGVPVTMRMLLSHQSGITDAADYILPLDGELSAVLARPASWDAEHAPGGWFRYANLNFPIVAAVMEAATGERFDRIMAREVFTPLKLDACFNWQTGCSAGRRAQAVTLLRPNGDLAKDGPLKDGPLGVGVPECVFVRASNGGCDIASYRIGRNGSAFSPQGGLRISAKDLMTIGKVLRDGGRPLLSTKAYAEMVRPQWTFNGRNGDDEKGAFTSYGLSLHIETDSKGVRWIGHIGEAYSLRAGLWINPDSKETRLKITTMVDEFAPVGNCLEVCP
jgi:CubicO group peptidase (beta-lactamase class C family)